MGCASSAPFMGEGGALGEIKEVANDLVESGENALHDVGEMAGKAVHNAVDHVKEAVSTATHGIKDAADHLGAAVHDSTNAAEAEAEAVAKSVSEAKFIPLKSMSEEADEDPMKTPPHSASSEMAVPRDGLFKPTPAPSFDKPPTPCATVLSISDMVDKPMEKIDEAIASATIEQLANDLINEAAEEAKEERDESECDDDLPPTKWEALADVMVELPPRMSIDLGTGQLYAVVEDEPPKSFKSYAKPAVLKGAVSAETS